MQMPIVTVIIPCRNEEKNIANAINSILNQDYPLELIEIIVVDGMSDDNSKNVVLELSKIYGNILLLENKNKTTPIAFNIGIREGKGDFVQILNARQILAENYISSCINILLNDNTIGCIGGSAKLNYVTSQEKHISLAYQSWFGLGFGNIYAIKGSAYTDTAAAPIYPKKALFEIGLFDESLIRNQDDELSFRLTKNNYKIYTTSKTSSYYLVRSTINKVFKQFFQYGYWKVFVMKKHYTLTTLRQVFPALFIIFILLGFPLFTYIKQVQIYFTILLLYVIVGLFFNDGKTVLEKISVLKIIITIHFAYGIGYLDGVIDFFLLNKKPSERNKTLSR